MKENELKILNLIKEYVKDIQFFTNLINRQTEIIKGFQVFKPTGYFDKEETLYYSFHGIGIYLKSHEKKVDFDFYSRGRTDGFRPWFIFNYIRSNSKFKIDFENFYEVDDIHEILKRLVNLGFLTKMKSKYQSDYFSLKGVKPVYFKPYKLSFEEEMAFYEKLKTENA